MAAVVLLSPDLIVLAAGRRVNGDAKAAELRLRSLAILLRFSPGGMGDADGLEEVVLTIVILCCLC